MIETLKNIYHTKWNKICNILFITSMLIATNCITVYYLFHSLELLENQVAIPLYQVLQNCYLEYSKYLLQLLSEWHCIFKLGYNDIKMILNLYKNIQLKNRSRYWIILYFNTLFFNKQYLKIKLIIIILNWITLQRFIEIFIISKMY